MVVASLFKILFILFQRLTIEIARNPIATVRTTEAGILEHFNSTIFPQHIDSELNEPQSTHVYHTHTR